MEVNLTSLLETEKMAGEFLSIIPQKNEGAVVVGLRGDLGSGKTTFVQMIAKKLGVANPVTSPTFVILKKYPIEGFEGFETLVHVDAYRLESHKELITLGFEEEIQNSKNLIFIEWPEKVSNILPNDALYIGFEFIDEGTRKIVFTK